MKQSASVGTPWSKIKDTVQRIGLEVAGPNANDVDKQARFPHETLAALKKEKLLGAFVPQELGGLGCDITTLGSMCESLGQHCSASGMVLAMHHIQVGCIVRHHGGSPAIASYLREL